MKSAIYEGKIWHKRRTPAIHSFSYNIFMMYLDLNELPVLFKPYWFWSYNKYNWVSFLRSDHFGDHNVSLIDTVKEFVLKQTGQEVKGPIRLLTHLRCLGYCFNPVCFYYIFDESDSEVLYVIAEVSNTPWRERYCYMLYQGNQNEKKTYVIRKKMHVSPFMEMDYEYHITVSPPQDAITITMKNIKEQKIDFSAVLKLRRKEISSLNLSKILIQYPAITIKVIIGIYWQALKLWLKKIPFINHPNL